MQRNELKSFIVVVATAAVIVVVIYFPLQFVGMMKYEEIVAHKWE